MKNLFKISLLIFILFCSSQNLYSDILNVPDINYPTIQAGIDSASAGDTVLISPGKYYENLTINHCIVLASHYFINLDTSFIALTLINGNMNGSVISCQADSVMITGLTLTNGISERGGGIFLESKSNLILDYVTIRDNKSDNLGGGIYCDDSSIVSMVGCRIHNNLSNEGGGLAVINSIIHLENVSIKGNQASGAGIFLVNSEAYLVGGNISNNSKNSQYGVHGSGIYCLSSILNIRDLTIEGNSASGWLR